MSSTPIGNPVKGGGQVPGDVDALERRVAEWYERYAIGPVSTKAGSQLFNDMLTALREQQALHKREQETTTVMINGLTHEITRLRAALKELVNWSEAYPLPVFPEPDLKVAREGLESVGITMDQVSASLIRHVVKRAGEIARKALEEK